MKLMNTDRMAKTALDWIPLGRQKWGRPRCRWSQGIQEAMMARNYKKANAKTEIPGDWEQRHCTSHRATLLYI
jgi:hypothetical protein